MQYLYLATVFAGALVCLLASILLFVRRKEAKRSRVILAVIVSFSVFNYITRFIALCNGETPELVVSAKLLLQANFMVLGYILYPIEVIAPGWLSFQRILKLYSYWLLAVVVYLISLQLGVEYTPYGSLLGMLAHSGSFEVWFRLLLSVLIFAPALIVFFIHQTRLYRNSDHIWVRKYVITLSVNMLAYMLVLMFNHPEFNILYYYVSVGCSLYIVYMELFDRLIVKTLPAAVAEEKEETIRETTDETDDSFLCPEKCGNDKKNSVLIQRLDNYMKIHKAWRNPDLSLNTLASELFTNRTSLAQAMRESDYENYSNYINRLRIEDFLQQIESGQMLNFQETFFFVGFRSRSTALRNFRQFTGSIPSEYFQKKDADTEEPPVK
jgi:AraC-like DNA-binding protein